MEKTNRAHDLPTKKPMSKAFIEAFNALAKEAHDTAVKKKWWDFPDDYELICALIDDHVIDDPEKDRQNALIRTRFDRNDAELIALMHSELSEALEALRQGNPPDDKIPEFSGVEAELADCVIRILDFAAARNMRIGEAIVAKMEMNKGRENRHGGKSF